MIDTESIARSSSSRIVDHGSTGSKIKTMRHDHVMSDKSAQDAEMFERLRALGMPSAIKLEDFMGILNMLVPPSKSSSSTQSTKGKVKMTMEATGDDVRKLLQFLSTHLVGRQEARKAREQISSSRERWTQMQVSVRPASHIMAPSIHTTKTADMLDDPLAVAVVRSDMAYRNMESARKEYALEIEHCSKLDMQKHGLSRELEEKRRIAYMLRVLEKREDVRLERIGDGRGDKKGLTKLVNDLRSAYNRSTSTSAIKSLQEELQEGIESIIRMPRNIASPVKRQSFKFKYTTEALSIHISGITLRAVPFEFESKEINLHALHVRQARRDENPNRNAELVGIETRNEAACEPVITKLEALLRRFGVKDKAEMERIIKQIVAVARQRAATRRQKALKAVLDHGTSASKDDETRLSAMHVANEEMKLQTQTKMDRIVALVWACERYVDLISTFRLDTAPALQSALCAEVKRVGGHVDVLRSMVMQTSRKPSSSFAQDVRNLLGSPRMAVADTVQDILTLVTASEELVGIRPSSHVDGKWPEIIMQTDRSKKLLERKAAKMEYGFEIADEVKETLEKVKKLRY